MRLAYWRCPLTSERWAWVPGYEGHYEVSSQGRVRSVERTVMRKHNKTERLVSFTYRAQPMRAWIAKATGYPMVTLRREGIKKQLSVHVALLEAFVGPRPPAHVACHFNGDPRDNRVENLRWDTQAANVADTKRHGREIHGEAHRWAKLTETDVRTIRARLATGEQCSVIGPRYGITPEAVSAIKTGKNWAWLQ